MDALGLLASTALYVYPVMLVTFVVTLMLGRIIAGGRNSLFLATCFGVSLISWIAMVLLVRDIYPAMGVMVGAADLGFTFTFGVPISLVTCMLGLWLGEISSNYKIAKRE